MSKRKTSQRRQDRARVEAAPAGGGLRRFVVPAIVVLALAVVVVWFISRDPLPTFSGERAFEHIERQVAFGPRLMGTEGHAAARAYFQEVLGEHTPRVHELPFEYVTPAGDTLQGVNIIASFHPDRFPRVMLATHYDTRAEADQDPDPARRTEPVPGANDGGSGVAVLLELARHLPDLPTDIGVDILLFDLEDVGEYASGEGDEDAIPFAIGSRRFTEEHADYRPAWGVVVDIVGDPDLTIPQEAFSLQQARHIVDRVWQAADRAGADAFVNRPGGAVMDDHVPFLERGIPVINIIHQPFPDTWHTTADTPENVSTESLQQVGDVLIELLWRAP